MAGCKKSVRSGISLIGGLVMSLGVATAILVRTSAGHFDTPSTVLCTT